MNKTTKQMSMVIEQYRIQLVKEIKAMVDPLLHDSAYMDKTEKDNVLRLVLFGVNAFNGKHYFVLRSFGENVDVEGYTKTGIITDAYAGVATREYGELTVEQLILLRGCTKDYLHKLER